MKNNVFTSDEKCPDCGSTERYTVTGKCAPCRRAYMNNYMKSYSTERKNEESRKNYLKYKVVKLKSSRDWYARNPDKAKEYRKRWYEKQKVSGE